MRCHRVSETLACYIKVSRRLLYCTSEPASFKSSRRFSKTRPVT